MMSNGTNRLVTEFEDSTVVAFLALRGHTVTPFKKPNGRVMFEVEGDIARDVDAFYRNEKVGILDFIRIFKSIRGSIFTLKTVG